KVNNLLAYCTTKLLTWPNLTECGVEFGAGLQRAIVAPRLSKCLCRTGRQFYFANRGGGIDWKGQGYRRVKWKVHDECGVEERQDGKDGGLSEDGRGSGAVDAGAVSGDAGGCDRAARDGRVPAQSRARSLRGC